ncbi:hypothetical protein BDP27DRAFT_1427904 [Rhodocollybia butyracea]|uniref:Uncharacterized protein n=1 Tax=Rhodocollybia butyracea TaxID=206335 RepID=A0A9P5U296_9AGAR|nr:hypothetical protein BDP27DRAFT_1427904 [Rhodocollybia butyracea]
MTRLPKDCLKWGGEVYREQRKYWTFRREAHSDVKGKEVAIPSPKSPEVKEKPVRVRSSSSTSRATPAIPTTSIATDTDDSSRESNHTTSQKGRKKERLRQDTWSNGLLGDWNVQREDVGRNGKNGRNGGKSICVALWSNIDEMFSDSSKGPQQRLLIRFRGDSMQNTEISPKADADHLQLPHPPITVHKHSKAMAFSLTRFYKTHSNYTSPSVHGGRPSTSLAGPIPPHLRPHFSAGGALSVSQTAGNKVILLAPRIIQEAFTSTTTTEMLAEHRLLGNGSRDVEKEAR